MEVFFAYHGTTKECADNILQTEKFIPGEDIDNSDFLGKGIYFFDEYNNAIFWNVRNFKKEKNKSPDYNEYISNYDIIEVIISVNKENLLDLNTTEGLVKFDKIVKGISKILDKNEEYRIARNKNAAIINLLFRKNMMEGIYCISQVIKQEMNVDSHHRTNDIKRKIFCVKDDRIISDMQRGEKVEESAFNDVLYLTFPVEKKYY